MLERKLHIKKIVLFFLLVYSGGKSFSQDSYPYDLPQYNFINYSSNKLIFFGDSSAYKLLFEKFAKLATKGEGQVNALHLGDSHIQADIFSGRIRERLQTFVPGLIGGRGFVFPYTVAKTNNPKNYKTTYTGKWDYCRNVERTKTCELGLSGISVSTSDTLASITIVLDRNNQPVYDFNRVKVFHSMDSSCFDLELNGNKGDVRSEAHQTLGFTEFFLDDYTDSLQLIFIRNTDAQTTFTLHGLSLETSDPGVVYHSIGINGANVNSFQGCALFSQHLQTIMPDWIIISFGTNDGYVVKLDTQLFEKNFINLIDLMRESFPETPILLTVPADNYRYRKTPNTNTELTRNMMMRIAQSKNCAVWDLYSIMGGFKSVCEWQKENLAASDKLHFTSAGYKLQGDLLFTAFLKSFDNFLENYKSGK